MMTYKLSAKNGVPSLSIEAIDIVRAIGIDWNWCTLPKIKDSVIRSFFGELHRALCAIDAPTGDNQDTDEYEQGIIMQNSMLQVALSVPSASVDWDESLWLYIYEHLDLWKSYIRGKVRLHTGLLHVMQTSDGISRIISIIRSASNLADAEEDICKTFAVDPNTAKEILNMDFGTLASLSVRSCSARLAYWTEAATIFNCLNNKTE